MKGDLAGHILECIGRIRENTAGGRNTFLVSHTLQDAVLRNVLVHDYLGIDIETVWEVVRADVPQLEITVHKMLDRLTR